MGDEGYLEYNGETLCYAEWEELICRPRDTITNRLKRKESNWIPLEALLCPIGMSLSSYRLGGKSPREFDGYDSWTSIVKKVKHKGDKKEYELPCTDWEWIRRLGGKSIP